jgi:hypothetical protein
MNGVGQAHVYRVWTDDLNHDGSADILAAQNLFSTSGNESKANALQVLINRGDDTFNDLTLKLNPDMQFETSDLDYTPTFLDIDNSGINTYLMSGQLSWSSMSKQADYILLNDGTGRLFVALHDQFRYFADKVFGFNKSKYTQNSTPPRFLAIPQNDGSINFLAEIPTNIVALNGVSNVAAFQYMNLPVHYNPKTDFIQNITISDRNNSMLMRTWAGNDVFYDTNANSKPTKIDGGLGNNKVIYSGSSAQYLVTRNSNGTATVISTSAAPIQVNDTLTNIQQIQFADKTVSLN